MRQRTTFALAPTLELDPKHLTVHEASLAVNGLEAGREDRLTFSLEELPQEVRDHLCKDKRQGVTAVGISDSTAVPRASYKMERR